MHFIGLFSAADDRIYIIAFHFVSHFWRAFTMHMRELSWACLFGMQYCRLSHAGTAVKTNNRRIMRFSLLGYLLDHISYPKSQGTPLARALNETGVGKNWLSKRAWAFDWYHFRRL